MVSPVGHQADLVRKGQPARRSDVPALHCLKVYGCDLFEFQDDEVVRRTSISTFVGEPIVVSNENQGSVVELPWV
jgi:hypothetical protein